MCPDRNSGHETAPVGVHRFRMTPSLPPSLLVVDDDRDIRGLLADHLEGQGFRVRKAADGRAMLAALEAAPADLIVLDLNLPGEDGLSLCRRVRAGGSTPIIMLTARGDPIDRIIGLEMGADDYLAKPFEPRELVARIRSVLRRAADLPANLKRAPATRAAFAGWTLDRTARALHRPDQRLVMLSGSEFDLLDALLEHAGRTVTRAQLRRLSAALDADDRAIDLRVSRLRQKLGDDARAPTLIQTVRNRGYVLAAEVEWRA